MPGRPSLPSKICAACGRPFSWRRRWARDWPAVKYCSAACRTGRYIRARRQCESDIPGHDPGRS